VVTNNSVFWDITPCNVLEVEQLFRRMCNPHVPLKYWLAFSRLHSIVSQKTELFIARITVDRQWATFTTKFLFEMVGTVIPMQVHVPAFPCSVPVCNYLLTYITADYQQQQTLALYVSKSKVKLSHNRPWRPIGL
jgi:hypothetical protein